jgi:hypothetical protein
MRVSGQGLTARIDSQNRTARTGQPELFSQNRTTVQGNQIGQTEQDCHYSTVRTVLLGQDI